MLEILIACFAIMLSSLGALFLVSSKIQRQVKDHLHLLIAFAVGVFGVVAYFLLEETFLHGTLLVSIISVLAGFVVMGVLPRLVPDFHHHHTSEGDHSHTKGSALRILASDGVHNTADGILITASFLAGGAVGIGVFLSIFIHEVVQGITEFFVLRQAGYSSKKAIVRNFAVQSTILIGAVGAYFFIEAFRWLEPVLLGVAAGGFLVVLLQDLIPDSYRSAKKTRSITTHIVAIGLGVLLMVIVSILGGHG